jgi:hypothetical protein
MFSDHLELFQISLHPWTDIVEAAIKRIGDNYYYCLPLGYMTGKDANPDQKESDIIFLAQYTERDWCYELYHQLRLEMNERSIDTSSPDGIRLSGEPSKRANYISSRRQGRWTQNANCRIPDILLHCPRHEDFQVFALEAKRARKNYLGSILNQSEVIDDLIALAEYIEGLGYWHGFFIGLGFDSIQLKNIVSFIKSPLREKFSKVASKITLFAVEDDELGGNSQRECNHFLLSGLLSDNPRE